MPVRNRLQMCQSQPPPKASEQGAGAERFTCQEPGALQEMKASALGWSQEARILALALSGPGQVPSPLWGSVSSTLCLYVSFWD